MPRLNTNALAEVKTLVYIRGEGITALKTMTELKTLPSTDTRSEHKTLDSLLIVNDGRTDVQSTAEDTAKYCM